jgi:hypothetical protein
LVIRSAEQKACDRFLLLWLISKASPLDRLKLQKLPFRAEYELNKEKKRGFNYEFFKYNQGPLSFEAYEDQDALKTLGLISETVYINEMNEEGRKLLAEFNSVIGDNKNLLDKIWTSVKDLSAMNSFELVEDTHKMTVSWKGKKCLLEDMPPYAVILFQPDRTCLKMDSSTLETLVVLLNPELIEGIRKARSEGSTISPYKPLVTA